MKLEEYAALYILNRLPGEKLPGVALQCIESDMESDAMLELAWEKAPALRDAAPVFERGLKELNVAVPSKSRALLLLANIYCKQMLSGEISPFEGAFNIWQQICVEDEAPEMTFEFVTWADALQNIGASEDNSPMRHSS